MDLLFGSVVLLGVAFAFVNGFHDAALSVGNAVVVRSLTPRWALFLATVFNFVGALLGEGIAYVVASEVVNFDVDARTVLIVIAVAFTMGLVWNIGTYLMALPVSSTHCLIGGLLGAGIAFGIAGNAESLMSEVLLPLLLSPLIGFLLAWVLTALAARFLGAQAPKPLFRKARIVNAVLTAALALVHGIQDAQKTAGIVMVAVFAYSMSSGLGESGNPAVIEISWPIRLLIAFAIAAGTGLSGWRVVRTLSKKMVKLDPVKSVVSNLSATFLMYIAALALKVPISLTFVLVSANIGTQFHRPRGAARLRYIVPVLTAWLLSIPVVGLFAYLLAAGIRLVAGI